MTVGNPRLSLLLNGDAGSPPPPLAELRRWAAGCQREAGSLLAELITKDQPEACAFYRFPWMEPIDVSTEAVAADVMRHVGRAGRASSAMVERGADLLIVGGHCWTGFSTPEDDGYRLFTWAYLAGHSRLRGTVNTPDGTRVLWTTHWQDDRLDWQARSAVSDIIWQAARDMDRAVDHGRPTDLWCRWFSVFFNDFSDLDYVPPEDWEPGLPGDIREDDVDDLLSLAFATFEPHQVGFLLTRWFAWNHHFGSRARDLAEQLRPLIERELD